MADDSSNGFLDLLGNVLNNAATGYGAGLAISNPIGGSRVPTGQTTNPTNTQPGAVGQPGTTPVVSTQVLPGVSNTMLLLGGGGVLLGLVLLVTLRK